MKLFVWNDPYSVRYGGAILYAVAETEDEARKVAANAMVSEYGIGQEANRQPFELGEPTRVLDVPCAEIYQWSE